MIKDEKGKSKKQESTTSKRVISKEDAEHYRYPNSKEPGVHSDSAPIGGG